MESYRGVVHDGIVVLAKGTPLPEGTEVVVTPVAGDTGSPAEIIAALKAAPRVPTEWVDELEQLIAEGRRSPARLDLFSDEPDCQESQ